ncbi:MAG: hypothetical protein HYW06_09335 [Gemmatimonadetes bacterium]|nr:hypothetical protein [Gemmatimonadota bacterium]
MRRSAVVTVALSLIVSGTALAQVTGQPSFNAPYRGFARYEFGAALSFPGYDQGPALEGVYRFASREFDVGFRGGVLFNGEEAVLAGVEGRFRAITHSVSFPLDGAVIFGGGLASNGGSRFYFPLGLSLGRRLNVEGSEVSIVPYAQPTLIVWNAPVPILGGRDTYVDFSFGLGGDFRLSRAFDVRVSIGIGDVFDGISIAAVWLR